MAPLFHGYRHDYSPKIVPTSSQPLSNTTTPTITHPVRFTHRVLTKSPISCELLVKISSDTKAHIEGGLEEDGTAIEHTLVRCR